MVTWVHDKCGRISIFICDNEQGGKIHTFDNQSPSLAHQRARFQVIVWGHMAEYKFEHLIGQIINVDHFDG